MRVKRLSSRMSGLAWAGAGVLVLGAAMGWTQQAQQSTPASSAAQAETKPGSDGTKPEVAKPDAAGPDQTSDNGKAAEPQGVEKKTPEELNAARRKQIAEESAALVKLAADLKTEVDKTSKDTLSLEVIRKAEEIEKLAHRVKENIKVTEPNH